jgi:uncharacterized protein YwqG
VSNDLQEELKTRLAAAGLGRLAGGTERLSREAFFLNAVTTSEDDVPVGPSKLGGQPDVPTDFMWPDVGGKRLAFVAQIDLSALPKSDSLPMDGVLSFFYNDEQSAWGFDPAHKEHSRVCYFPAAQKLMRTESRIEKPNKGLLSKIASFHKKAISSDSVFQCREISPIQFASIPDVSAEVFETVLVTEDESERDSDAYAEFRESYPLSGPRHQLLGWPTPIQNEMELECQLVSNGIYVGDARGYKDPRAARLREGIDDWQLLLQIDSDDDAQMAWGDGGMIYFWIRKQDLENRAFDKAWLILQSF